MFDIPKLQYVSWDEFHQMGFELAQKITQSNVKLDLIVSISRGGHVLARILSDFLKLSIFSVSIQSYKSIQKQGGLKVVQELGLDLTGKHILLVDEIVDSGKTLERALAYLHDLRAAEVTSVALFVKPQASCKSDFFGDETDKWVVYPYEVRETFDGLLPIWKKEGKSADDVKKALVEIGIKPEFVAILK